MIPNCCRLFSVLLLLTTGCTYNPVHFDPNSGFQMGGGVGVLCGGPLDPLMLHCCQPCGCAGPCSCLPAPACPTPCPTPCPAPVFPAPMCPTPCPTPGMPFAPGGGMVLPQGANYAPQPTWGAAPAMIPTAMPGVPMGAPQAFQPGMMPTAPPAAHCESCNSNPGAAMPGYPQAVEAPLPGVSNYPHLFQAPQAAPQYVDQFQMPTPIPGGQIPPSPEQLPPNYQVMDPPMGQFPATMPPMNTNPPMQPTPMPMGSPTPVQQQPMPMPMPVTIPQGTNATPTSYPGAMQPGVMQQGVMQPGMSNHNAIQPSGVMLDSRRQQWFPVRL